MEFSFDVFEMAGTHNLHFPEGEYVLSQGWNSRTPTKENHGLMHSFTIHALYSKNVPDRGEKFLNFFDKFSISEILLKRKEYAKNDPLILETESDNLLADMSKYWNGFDKKNSEFWRNECWKHCPYINGKVTEDKTEKEIVESIFQYFFVTMKLHKKLDTASFLKEKNIIPSPCMLYTKDYIQKALQSKFGKVVNIHTGQNATISGVDYHFHFKDGKFEPIRSKRMFTNEFVGPIHFFPKFTSFNEKQQLLKSIPYGCVSIYEIDSFREYGHVTKRGEALKAPAARSTKFFMYHDLFGNVFLKGKSGYMNCYDDDTILSIDRNINSETCNDIAMNYDEATSELGYDGIFTWFTDSVLSTFNSATIYRGSEELYKNTHVERRFRLVFEEYKIPEYFSWML